MLVKRISRSGGSLMLTFPKPWLKDAGFKVGDYVTVELLPDKSIKIDKLESTLHSKKAKVS